MCKVCIFMCVCVHIGGASLTLGWDWRCQCTSYPVRSPSPGKLSLLSKVATSPWPVGAGSSLLFISRSLHWPFCFSKAPGSSFLWSWALAASSSGMLFPCLFMGCLLRSGRSLVRCHLLQLALPTTLCKVAPLPPVSHDPVYLSCTPQLDTVLLVYLVYFVLCILHLRAQPPWG